MAPFKPTNEDLINTLEHIFYEISQLLGTLTNNDSRVAVKRALLESKLIHVRVLFDFFTIKEKPRFSDDVFSSAYGFPPQEFRGFDMLVINKTLAHLTYTRARQFPAGKLWLYEESVLPILERCKEFCEHLISKYLPGNCPGKIEEWEMLNVMIGKELSKEYAPNTSR